MFKYYVCDELGQTLSEHFNEVDAMENCNWTNGQSVSKQLLKEVRGDVLTEDGSKS